MLIHANRHWPSAVNHYLWPYALRHANAVINSTPSLVKDRNNRSPEQMFSKSTVNINVKHWVPFGCCTYCLDNTLQNRKKINKWQQCAHVGLYLGLSAQHARTVALVLNIQTGLTSPQFHVQFNTKFETMCKSFVNNIPVSLWQQKCHFTSANPGDNVVPSQCIADHGLLPQQPPTPPGPAQPDPPDPPEFPDGAGGNGGDDDDGNNSVGSSGLPPPPLPLTATVSQSARAIRLPACLIEIMEAQMEEIRMDYIIFEALRVPTDTMDWYLNTNPLLAYAQGSLRPRYTLPPRGNAATRQAQILGGNGKGSRGSKRRLHLEDYPNEQGSTPRSTNHALGLVNEAQTQDCDSRSL
jgi:hypothetical protein